MRAELIETTLTTIDAQSPLIERLAASVIRHEQALPGQCIPDGGVLVTVFVSSNGTALTLLENDDGTDVWDPPGIAEDIQAAIRSAGLRFALSARIVLRVLPPSAQERMIAMGP